MEGEGGIRYVSADCLSLMPQKGRVCPVIESGNIMSGGFLLKYFVADTHPHTHTHTLHSFPPSSLLPSLSLPPTTAHTT